MASTIEELTVNYYDEDGQQIIREIDKQVLSKGAWPTIMFLFTEWDRTKKAWGPPKARIERFQKRNGEYRSHAKFKFTSAKQAQQIVDVFKEWIENGQFGGDEDEK